MSSSAGSSFVPGDAVDERPAEKKPSRCEEMLQHSLQRCEYETKRSPCRDEQPPQTSCATQEVCAACSRAQLHDVPSLGCVHVFLSCVDVVDLLCCREQLRYWLRSTRDLISTRRKYVPAGEATLLHSMIYRQPLQVGTTHVFLVRVEL